MSDFVTKKKFAKDTGASVRTIEGWIYSRKWIRGIHYVVVGKTTMIDKNEVNTWLRQQDSLASTFTTVESELEFHKTKTESKQDLSSLCQEALASPHKLI